VQPVAAARREWPGASAGSAADDRNRDGKFSGGPQPTDGVTLGLAAFLPEVLGERQRDA